MKRLNRIGVIYIVIILILVLVGLLWQSRDYDKISKIDYRTNSKQIMRRVIIDPPAFRAEIKEIMSKDLLTIIRDYQVDEHTWEIIGQSDKYWLLADYINKATIVEIPAAGPSQETRYKEMSVYDGYIHAGSEAYLAIVFFCIMIIAVCAVDKNSLPHLFLKSK